VRSSVWSLVGVSALCGCMRGAALDGTDGGVPRVGSNDGGSAIAPDGGHPTPAIDAGGPAPDVAGPASDGGRAADASGPSADAARPATDASGPSADAAGPTTDAGHATDAGVPAASCPIGVGRGSAAAPPPPAYVRACDSGLTPAPSYTLVPDGVQTGYHRCGELGEVASAATISRDGRRLAVVAAESVRLFDTATWREVARVAHAAEPLDAAALSPDGRRLATVASYIGEVTLWDSFDGSATSVFPGTVASAGTLARGSGIAFSSDGRRIATSMGTIIDTLTGTSVGGASQIRGGQNSGLWFTAGDAGLLARTLYHSGDSWVGTLIQRFDAATGTLQAGVGDSVVLSGDLTQAVGVIDQWSTIYSVVGIGLPTPVTELSLQLSMIPSVDWRNSYPAALDHRGDLLALSDGTELRIVEAQHPDQEVARIPVPAGTTVVGVSPADELVTSGPCGTIAWDWRSGQARWAQPFTVRTIAWSPDGSLATATGPDALFRVWRVDTGADVCAPPGGRAVTDRIFSADGSAVLVRYDDGSVEVRRGDLTDTQPVARGALGTSAPLALANDASAMAIWADLPQPQPLPVGQAPNHRLEVRRIDGSLIGAGPIDTSYRPYRVVLSPDLTRVVYQSNMGTLLVDVVHGTTIAPWNPTGEPIGFSSDGARFALVAPDGIATFFSRDGSAGPVMRPAGQTVSGGMLSADWTVAVSDLPYSGNAAPGGQQAIRWQTPDGPAQTIPADDLGPAVLSADGSLIIHTEEVFHEFTGDYFDVIVRDTATGALVQRFFDHPVTPSADGKRLFGYDGAVFCR
jgi:WD40 repeat protein